MPDRTRSYFKVACQFTFAALAGSFFLSGCSSTEPSYEVLAIRVEPRNIGMLVGDSLLFRVVAVKQDRSETTLSPTTVEFRSSNAALLQISDAGMARAQGIGSAYVVASYTDKGRLVRDSAEVVLTKLN